MFHLHSPLALRQSQSDANVLQRVSNSTKLQRSLSDSENLLYTHDIKDTRRRSESYSDPRNVYPYKSLYQTTLLRSTHKKSANSDPSKGNEYGVRINAYSHNSSPTSQQQPVSQRATLEVTRSETIMPDADPSPNANKVVNYYDTV